MGKIVEIQALSSRYRNNRCILLSCTALECKQDRMRERNKGWAIQARMDDRSYRYNNANVDGTNLVSADVSMVDVLVGPMYRIPGPPS